MCSTWNIGELQWQKAPSGIGNQVFLESFDSAVRDEAANRSAQGDGLEACWFVGKG